MSEHNKKVVEAGEEAKVEVVVEVAVVVGAEEVEEGAVNVKKCVNKHEHNCTQQ